MADQSKLSGDRKILSIIVVLAQALRMCRQNEAFCGGVTFSQFIILDAVAEHETLTMENLRDILSVDKSTATRLVALDEFLEVFKSQR
ncbi:MAG TPA: helix-turn-helix domain-containing protein [Bacteroidales bacterium]|nr:helix-turn-helix domain-containing protein [Bacteroidales bacterium]